jgi:hypothetical protein
MKLLLLIMYFFIFSTAHAEPSAELAIEQLAVEQSENFRELGWSAGGIVGSRLFSKLEKIQVQKTLDQIKLDKETYKKVSTVQQTKKKSHPSNKDLNKQKAKINQSIKTNSSKWKLWTAGGFLNVVVLSGFALSLKKDLIDLFVIRSKMDKIIECNPGLLEGAAPIGKTQADNILDIVTPISN